MFYSKSHQQECGLSDNPETAEHVCLILFLLYLLSQAQWDIMFFNIHCVAGLHSQPLNCCPRAFISFVRRKLDVYSYGTSLSLCLAHHVKAFVYYLCADKTILIKRQCCLTKTIFLYSCRGVLKSIVCVASANCIHRGSSARKKLGLVVLLV